MSGLFDLTGHVAVVTGGNRGLGLAMARGLIGAGAKVAIWARDAERNAAAARDLGENALAVQCDVLDEAQVDRAMDETFAALGRLDSCFANAGGSGRRGPFLELPTEAWRDTMDLNVTSVISTFKAATHRFAEQGGGGKLVATSSLAALLGLPAGAYSASKAALTGLVRSLAIELGPQQIVVNAILPGFIETELSTDTPKWFQDGCRRRTASGQVGTLDDMQGIAVFLASDASRLITGQTIVMDAGHSVFPM